MSTPAPAVLYEVGRPINEIIADLSKPIPESLLRTRNQGGTDLTYIPWFNATRLLDLYAPGWTFKLEHKEMAGKIVCHAWISIVAKELTVTRMASGNEDDKTSKYGDPWSNSESMALRRAAAKFGLGRYLYQ